MDKSRYKEILDAVPDMFFVVDGEGVLLDFKPSSTFPPLVPPEKFLGNNLRQFLPAEVSDKTMNNLAEVLESDVEKTFEYTLELQGERRYFEARLSPLKDKKALILVRDITEKVDAQSKLKETFIRYRSVFEDSPIPMYVHDLDTFQIIDVNQAMIDNYGYSRDEFLSMTIGDIRSEEDISPLHKHVSKLKGRNNYRGIWRHQKKDGSIIDVETTSHNFPRGNENIRMVRCNDVTEQIATQKALFESEEKFSTIFFTNPDAITITSVENGELLEINDMFLNGTGYKRDEVIGRSSVDLGLWLDSTQRENFVDELKSKGKVENFEVRLRIKNGTIRTSLISACVIKLSGVPHILSITRDITDIEKTRQALEESENRFRTVFRMSPDAILLCRLENRELIDISEGYPRITGYSAEDVLGKSCLDSDFWQDPEMKLKFFADLENDGMINNFEADFRRKDGTVFSGYISATVVEIGGDPHLLAILRDISELKAIQVQLRSSLEEKDILLREIHHRVKNNLQVISGLLNLQSRHISDPDVLTKYKESQSRIVAMSLIHEELYQGADLSRIQFNQYIQNLCNNLLGFYGIRKNRIKLIINAQETNLTVDTAIPCGLIINELVTNALKHAFPGGRKGRIRLDFQRTPDEKYELVISDNGIGMPEGLILGELSSLGMQLVRILVEQLGGIMEVEREKGTTFRITLKEYFEAGTILH